MGCGAAPASHLSAIVCWRLDSLGRTAKGLTALFHELYERKVNLVSLKDGIDLNTPAGRLMANMLASVAQYETEVRAERVMAGQARARSQGKRWGGSVRGPSAQSDLRRSSGCSVRSIRFSHFKSHQSHTPDRIQLPCLSLRTIRFGELIDSIRSGSTAVPKLEESARASKTSLTLPSSEGSVRVLQAAFLPRYPRGACPGIVQRDERSSLRLWPARGRRL